MGIDLNHNITVSESTAARPGATPDPTASGEEHSESEPDLPSVRTRAAALAERVNQLPETLLEKVAAIAHALRQGTYRVSPEQTAEAILSELHTSQVGAA